jgi:hypothetical protein
LVSKDPAGDGADRTTNQGTFGGLVFVIMPYDTPDDGSGNPANNSTVPSIFLGGRPSG